jgi:hypothetical protein
MTKPVNGVTMIEPFELPVTKLENPFCNHNIEYIYTGQGVFYADSRPAAHYGNVVYRSLPASFRDSLLHEARHKGLMLFFHTDNHRPDSFANWSYSPKLRLSLQNGSHELPFRAQRLPYDGIQIHVHINDKNFNLDAVQSHLSHEFLGHHYWFKQNFRIATRFGFNMDSILLPGDLCDPSFFRHRMLLGRPYPRVQLDTYFVDARKHVAANNINSVFDIPLKHSTLPSAEELLFRRPTRYFAKGIANDLKALLPAEENIGVFVNGLLRKHEAQLFQGQNFRLLAVAKDIRAQYPSLSSEQVKGLLNANAARFREELPAHFNQCEFLYPSSTLKLAPNTRSYYDKLQQSTVVTVPDLGNPAIYKTHGPQNFNQFPGFQWSAAARTGFKLFNVVGNVVDAGNIFSQEWDIAKQAYPYSPVPAAFLRGSSRIAVESAWWGGIAYCAGGWPTLALGAMTHIAEECPDLEQAYRKAIEPLNGKIDELKRRNASPLEYREMLEQFYAENPIAHPDVADGVYVQKLLRFINVPAHFRRFMNGLAESTPEYQKGLQASTPQLPVFPVDLSLEQPNPIIYPIDGDITQTTSSPISEPRNPVAAQTENSGIPKVTYTHKPAAEAIANVEFKFDAKELATNPATASTANVQGTLTFETEKETQRFWVMGSNDAKQMSLRPINKDTALLPKEEGNKYSVIASQAGTGMALTLATGGTVSFTIGEGGVVVSCEIGLSTEALSALSAAAPYFIALAAVVYAGFKVADFYFKRQEHKLKKMLKHSQQECLKLQEELKAMFKGLKKLDFNKMTHSGDYYKIVKKIDLVAHDLRVGLYHEYRRADRSHGMYSKSYHTHNTRHRTYLVNLKQCGEIKHSLELRQVYLKCLEDNEDKTSRELILKCERITARKINVMGVKLQVALTDKDVTKLEALRSLVYRKAIIHCNMGNFKKAEYLVFRLSQISYYKVNAIQSFSILDCGSHILNNTAQRLLTNFEKGIVRTNQIIGSGENPVGAILGLVKYIDEQLLPEFNHRLKHAPKHGPENINSSKEVDKTTWSSRIAALRAFRAKLVEVVNGYSKEGNQRIPLDDGSNLKLFQQFKDGDQKPLSHWFESLSSLNILRYLYAPEQQAILRAGFDYFIMQGVYKELVAGKLDSAESLLEQYDKHLSDDDSHKGMVAKVRELKLNLNKGASFWLEAMRSSKAISEDKRTPINQLELLIGPGRVYEEVSLLIAQSNYDAISPLTSQLSAMAPGQSKFIHSISEAVTFMQANENQDCAFWEGQLQQRCPKQNEDTTFPQELIRSKAQQHVSKFAVALALSGNINGADEIFARVLPYAYDPKQVNELREKLNALSSKKADTPEKAIQELKEAVQKTETDPSLVNHLELSFTENNNYEIAIQLVAAKQYDVAISHLRDVLEKNPQDQEIILLMIERIESAKQSKSLVALTRDLKELTTRKSNLADPLTKERWQLVELDEKILTTAINDHANELSSSGYFYLSAKAHSELIAYKADPEREALHSKLLYEHEVQVTHHFVGMVQSFANIYVQRMADTPRKRNLQIALDAINTTQIVLPTILTTVVQVLRRLPQGNFGLVRSDVLNLFTRSWQDLRSPFAGGMMLGQLSLRGLRFLNLNPATSNRIQTYGYHAIRLITVGRALHSIVTKPGRRVETIANVMTLINAAHHFWSSWRESSRQRRGDSIVDAGYYYRQEMLSAALDWFGNVTYLPELIREQTPATLISGMVAGFTTGYRAFSKSAYEQAVTRALLVAVNDMHLAERYLALHRNIDQYKLSFVREVQPRSQLLKPEYAMTISIKSTEDKTEIYFVENESLMKSTLSCCHHTVLREILSSVDHNVASIDTKSIQVIKEMLLLYVGENYFILNKFKEGRIRVRQQAPAELDSSTMVLITGVKNDVLYFNNNQGQIKNVSLEKTPPAVLETLKSCPVHRPHEYLPAFTYVLTKVAASLTHIWLDSNRDVILNYLCDNFDGLRYQPNKDTLNRVRAALLGNLIREHFQNKNYDGVLSATSKVAVDSEIVNARYRLPAYYLWREIVFNRLMIFLLSPERLLDFQDQFNQYSFLVISFDPSATEQEKSEIREKFNEIVKLGMRQYLGEAASRKGDERLPYLQKIMANYRNVRSWHDLLEDKDKLIAAILAYEVNESALCLLFYSSIRDIKALLAKKNMDLLPMALMLLANIDPVSHEHVCSEENWVTYGVTSEFAKAHASALVNKKKYYLAAKLLNCNLEFANKHTLRALCQLANFKPHDFVNILKTLLWELDQDFMYWDLLLTLLRECLLALNYVTPHNLHNTNRLMLLYLMKFCMEKSLEKIKEIQPEHQEAIKSQLDLQKVQLAEMIEQFEIIRRANQLQPLNEEQLKEIFSSTPRNRQTFIRELVEHFSERVFYRGRPVEVVPVANSDEGECIFQALGTTREEAITLLRSHLQEQERLRAQVASRPIVYLLEHFANTDNPLRFNADCYRSFYQALDALTVKGKLLTSRESEVGIYNAIAHLMKKNLVVYKHDEELGLALFSDQRENDPDFEDVFLLYTQSYHHGKGVVTNNHYTRLMVVNQPQRFSAAHTRGSFFFRAPAAFEPGAANNPGAARRFGNVGG